MVPFFFRCGIDVVGFVGAATSAISSSVEGGEEREEREDSESAMAAVVRGCSVCRGLCSIGMSREREVRSRMETDDARPALHEVILSYFASPEINRSI
jgi:hypothetical protein